MGRAVLHSIAGSGQPSPVSSSNPLPVDLVGGSTAGLSVSGFLSNAAVIASTAKASAGKIYGVDFFNTGTSPVYVRLYNKATAPGAADTPIWRGVVPAGGSLISKWDHGLQCGVGVGYRCTAGSADNDNTALSTTTVSGNVIFK